MLAGSASRSRPSCHSAAGFGDSVKVPRPGSLAPRTSGRRSVGRGAGVRPWRARRRRGHAGFDAHHAGPRRGRHVQAHGPRHLDPERAHGPGCLGAEGGVGRAGDGDDATVLAGGEGLEGLLQTEMGRAVPPRPPPRGRCSSVRSRRFPAITTSPGPSHVSRARARPAAAHVVAGVACAFSPRLATTRARRPTSTGTVRTSGPVPAWVPGTRVGASEAPSAMAFPS